jgi:HEAT repeat protein
MAFLMRMVRLEAEPSYAGKNLGDWIDSGHEDACQAVHEIGPAALPYILDKLAREDPRFGSNSRYARLYVRLPLPVRRLLTRPGPTNFDESRASSLLVELGPAAIPLLAEALHGTNPAVREVSAHVLGLMSARGKNIQVAIPNLRAASRDAYPQVATRAKWALGVTLVSSHE